MRSRGLAVVLVASIAALGACSNNSGKAQSAPDPSAPSGPEMRETTSPVPGQPVIGPTAVRVMTVSANTTNELRLGVVGPEQTTYRLRVGKTVTACRQTNGEKLASPGADLPPNAVSPAVLSCSAAPTRQTVVRSGVLLVKTDIGDGFLYDYEVPVARDL